MKENVFCNKLLDRMSIIILAPGISKDDVEVRGEVENKSRDCNMLYIHAAIGKTLKEKLDSVYSDKMLKPQHAEYMCELDVDHSVEVAAKYDIDKTEVEVKDGIINITVPVKAGVIKKIESK
jgi:HSP20 family molecular chaperone IbpA